MEERVDFIGVGNKIKNTGYNCIHGNYKMQQFIRLINPFPNKPWFLPVCITRLLKTLREKEKLLLTSNFYQYCHLQTLSVWKSLKFVVWERVR